VTRNSAYGKLTPILSAVRSLKNRVSNLIDSPVLVLVYHRVTSLPTDRQQLAVSPENFRSQLVHLKDAFQIVRFEAAWTDVRGPSVAVTFDDGYADNVQQALPILAELEVPATFFVSSGTLGTRQEFWWDELERVILWAQYKSAPFELKDPRYGRTWTADSAAQRDDLFRNLHALIPRLKPGRREDWLEQLRAWAKLDETGREINRTLTPEELATLAASPWSTIGAHTVTHTPLSILSEEDQRDEILSSKEKLAQLTGTNIEVFSYPFGTRTHYNRTSVRICREAGFLKAAANFPGQAHRWTDPYQIPRQLVRNWDGETFAAQLRSFWT
jgi:peptidoglycan/xylan/chitin deacetylase (PgdA/CDA1 family)